MLQKVPKIVGTERELLLNRRPPVGDSQRTYSYEHIYYHFEENNFDLRKNNFMLMRLVLKLKLANDNSLGIF